MSNWLTQGVSSLLYEGPFWVFAQFLSSCIMNEYDKHKEPGGLKVVLVTASGRSEQPSELTVDWQGALKE